MMTVAPGDLDDDDHDDNNNEDDHDDVTTLIQYDDVDENDDVIEDELCDIMLMVMMEMIMAMAMNTRKLIAARQVRDNVVKTEDRDLFQECCQAQRHIYIETATKNCQKRLNVLFNEYFSP